MLELKGYITNLGKYNEGELIGEWVTFPVDEDELENVLERIGINEEYEEYFITDYDCELSVNFGEYASIDELNDFAEKLDEWKNDEDLLKAASEVWSVDEVLNNTPDDYYLYTNINTDYDLGYYWIEESGCYNTSALGNLSNYIDYEAFGRDVRFECDGDFTDYGWIEYVG